ncbi:SDR family NAD(P)-dependent oxidoreductase [Arthrobacter sp. ISL-28]|uniref:SDR family NAD(P)-dependent oxidoreductase n=1 Tax=Arthrobacter sp. ISL-28 TaxID=2819108 RepID=UPI001BE57EB0|nr:SDR family NAD(P)-dependent oxidoreductase [Arthrobacter sp. ISL-28]MBT2523324.1 SDR family NAD(P)-dependent oxidoreductase [Arthrobacter sp. ISL-28]
MEISNSVGVVTGGASGLGAGVVRMLIERGGRAAILDLDRSPGSELAAELGDAALFIPTDITDPEQVESAFGQLAERFGRVDLCVNSAGTGEGHRVVAKDGTLFPLDAYKRIVNLNLVALFDVSRRAAELMTRNEPGADDERGLIVNVASIAGYEGQVGQAAYAGSKGAVIASTLPLARDLAQWGIRVMTIAPGIMDTAMLSGVSDKLRTAVTDLSLFPRRLGRPSDFASLVGQFMENTMLNGEVVRLDAGTRLPSR